MDNSSVYAISFAAVFVCLFLWRLLTGTPYEVYRCCVVFLRENLTYRLLYRRLSGSADITPLGGMCLLAYVSGNVAACTISVADTTQLAQRLGVLAAVNLVPLCSGGPTSAFERKILGLSFNNSRLIHHWVGRVCAAQALAHAVLHISAATWKFSPPQTAVRTAGRRHERKAACLQRS